MMRKVIERPGEDTARLTAAINRFKVQLINTQVRANSRRAAPRAGIARICTSQRDGGIANQPLEIICLIPDVLGCSLFDLLNTDTVPDKQ
jgi:hypothetical protein